MMWNLVVAGGKTGAMMTVVVVEVESDIKKVIGTRYVRSSVICLEKA